jgi:hypothetical protein
LESNLVKTGWAIRILTQEPVRFPEAGGGGDRVSGMDGGRLNCGIPSLSHCAKTKIQEKWSKKVKFRDRPLPNESAIFYFVAKDQDTAALPEGSSSNP